MAIYHRDDYSTTPSLSSLGALVRRESAITPQLRTLDDIRNQVAQEVAMRTIAKGKRQDGVRIGLCLTISKTNDESFLRNVAAIIHDNLRLQDHLFIVGTTGVNSSTQASPVDSFFPASPLGGSVQTTNTLIIFGSSYAHIDRARLLTGSKFLGRIVSATDELECKQWIAGILDLGADPFDEDALWDVARKSVRASVDPRLPPSGSKGIDEILAEARARLARLTPTEAYAELRRSSRPANDVDAPAFLVDIRPEAQRDREGGIGGSLIIERSLLEWRFDPRSDARLPIVDRYDLRVIVFCQEGHPSSLAAYSLQQLGLYNTTDIIGGFKAWREAGLPIDGPIEPTEIPIHTSFLSSAGSLM